MARRVFYSFHYIPDNWRASQVRNIGKVEGNKPATDNDWETVTKGGETAIQKWIDDQLYGRSCTVVLIGRSTANRKWINYEIVKSWNDKKGVLGIYIHNLKNSNGEQSAKGYNPFDYITIGNDEKKMSSVVRAYDPPYSSSQNVYEYISNNLEDWIEEAISIRENF